MSTLLIGPWWQFVDAASALVAVQRTLFTRFESSLGVSAYDFWIGRVIPRKRDDDIEDGECQIVVDLPDNSWPTDPGDAFLWDLTRFVA